MSRKERLIQSLRIIDEEILRLVSKRQEIESLLEVSIEDDYNIGDIEREYIGVFEE